MNLQILAAAMNICFNHMSQPNTGIHPSGFEDGFDKCTVVVKRYNEALRQESEAEAPALAAKQAKELADDIETVNRAAEAQ